MLTNVYEYDKINRSTLYIISSPILSPIAKTAYLVVARIVPFSVNSQNKTECSVHLFRTAFS